LDLFDCKFRSCGDCPELPRVTGSLSDQAAIKLTGDGILVEFASAVDAVECAVALQNGMAER
jgi:class 3 adenylate cyclase